MTKSQCYLNLGLILLVGAIFTIIANHIFGEPDYIRFSLAAFLGGIIVFITPALIILIIGLIIRWIKKSVRETANPQIKSDFVTYSYTSQTEEDKKKMEVWEKKNFLDKLDRELKPSWKTIFIIAWIVFLLINIMAIYGNWKLMNSN